LNAAAAAAAGVRPDSAGMLLAMAGQQLPGHLLQNAAAAAAASGMQTAMRQAAAVPAMAAAAGATGAAAASRAAAVPGGGGATAGLLQPSAPFMLAAQQLQQLAMMQAGGRGLGNGTGGSMVRDMTTGFACNIAGLHTGCSPAVLCAGSCKLWCHSDMHMSLACLRALFCWWFGCRKTALAVSTHLMSSKCFSIVVSSVAAADAVVTCRLPAWSFLHSTSPCPPSCSSTCSTPHCHCSLATAAAAPSAHTCLAALQPAAAASHPATPCQARHHTHHSSSSKPQHSSSSSSSRATTLDRDWAVAALASLLLPEV
jgi:hypothetical protein